MVAFNKGQLLEELNVPVGELFPDGTVLKDVWKGHEYTISNGTFKATLLPKSALVLGTR